MNRTHNILVAAASCFLVLGTTTDVAATTLYGPTPYLSFDDSPFKAASGSLGQFYLETFEDGSLNTPGVTITSNQQDDSILGVVGPGAFLDSVDGDDGVIDGLGQNGRSYANLANNGYENFGLTVTFTAIALNGLPAYAGLVWTDGSQTDSTLFEAFDANGISLGTIGPVKIGDSTFAGTTGEDRFFGVFNASGISKLTIRTPGGDNNMEIDHLQYGLTAVSVPEPSSIQLLAVGLIGILTRLQRQRVNAHGGGGYTDRINTSSHQ
jgi:PEP-CTERM motif